MKQLFRNYVSICDLSGHLPLFLPNVESPRYSKPVTFLNPILKNYTTRS